MREKWHISNATVTMYIKKDKMIQEQQDQQLKRVKKRDKSNHDSDRNSNSTIVYSIMTEQVKQKRFNHKRLLQW